MPQKVIFRHFQGDQNVFRLTKIGVFSLDLELHIIVLVNKYYKIKK